MFGAAEESSSLRPPPNTFPQMDPLSCAASVGVPELVVSTPAPPAPPPPSPGITITGGGGGGAVGGRLEHLSRFVVAAVGEVPDPYRVVARAGDDPGAGWRGGDREDVTGVAREGAPGEVEVVRWRR